MRRKGIYGKHQKPKHSEVRGKNGARKIKKGMRYTNKNEKENNLKQFLINKKIVKKNQVVLVATALMVCTAGYMNYTNNTKMASLGDAQLVSANVIDTENAVIEENKDTESNEEIISTSSKTTDEYYTNTRLERDTMYSQMIETYQKILENNSIPNDQKSIASNEIKNINNRKNSIATMENLIKTKGIEETVILYNDSSVNVIVKTDKELTKEQVAQITNIVVRESGVDIEDIHVSEKN